MFIFSRVVDFVNTLNKPTVSKEIHVTNFVDRSNCSNSKIKIKYGAGLTNERELPIRSSLLRKDDAGDQHNLSLIHI